MDSVVVVNGYPVEPGAYDEMWDGQIRPHWQPFCRAIEAFGSDELERRRQEVRRLLRENGVTYNVQGALQGLQRPWELDAIPLLISGDDWASIEAGLMQRAGLFNLILTDLYGPRQLIKRGLLPLELIYSHSGFLRACDQVRLPGAHQLLLYAVDLARGHNGRMWVLSDRTQTPHGVGYALENRTVLARTLPSLFRDCRVRQLSSFFRALRTGLAAIAPHRKDDPRIVMLTPGPRSETYFEHAYLAAALGYTLVQGDDLTVRDGYVWLKSLDGLQLVDIIVRRVDDHFCDPLELRQDSRRGVAGLLEAVRRGNVAVANPPGSGVLENPGLMAFLPGIAQYLLGEELRLPSAATWWCGQPKEREYVLQHLDRLVIKTMHSQPAPHVVFGDLLSKAERTAWRDRIQAQPHLYVGQEQISFATAPTLRQGEWQPHRTVIRAFLVAQEQGYAVMPGALTRSAPAKEKGALSTLAGEISKDTWILASEPQQPTRLWLPSGTHEITPASKGVLPSRAAENLFWVGRYAERAEGTARLLRTILRKLNESGEFAEEAETACLGALFDALIAVTDAWSSSPAGTAQRMQPEPEVLAVTLDTARRGSLAGTLQALVRAAYAIRDRWSTDTWRVFDDIEERWADLQATQHVSLHRVQNELDQLVTALVALAGLTMESMTRELGWLMLDIGRRIERGVLLVTLLRSTLVSQHEPLVEYLLLEAVIATCESLMTYRRRYRAHLQLQTVLELLLLDGANPRSLAYQLEHLQQHIAKLPRERSTYRLSEEERVLLEASSRLHLSNLTALAQVAPGTTRYQELDELLAHLGQLLAQTSNILTQTYFSHAQGPQQLVPTRAESAL